MTDSVKIEPLHDGNYATWAVRMRALLEHKDLWDVVNVGPPVVPEGADAMQRAAAAAYQRQDRQARSLIALNVSDALLTIVAANTTAKLLWDAFEALYKATSTARRQQLRRSLASLKKKTDETLTAYFNRARGIRDDLLAIGHGVDEDTVVGAILSGLPESYDTTVEIVEASAATLNMNDVFAKLLQTEQRQERKGQESAAPGSTNALVARGGGRYKATPGKKPKNSREIECWHCGKKGHRRSECRKLKQEQASSASASFAMTAGVVRTKQDQWILDSGASQHMAWDKANFSTYKRLPETAVSACDGNKVVAVGIGDVDIAAEVDGRVNRIRLKDVLHVPSLVVNLFSNGKADDNGAHVQVKNGRCFIKMRGETALTGRKVEGMYILDTKKESCCYSRKVESAELWHRRFGHLGYDNLKKLQDGSLVTGVNTPAREFEALTKKVLQRREIGSHKVVKAF
jgi:gag-polypeptide of LTR copia-type/GAG-pre-integrase domain/Domain of unknown function (DUF4219)